MFDERTLGTVSHIYTRPRWESLEEGGLGILWDLVTGFKFDTFRPLSRQCEKERKSFYNWTCEIKDFPFMRYKVERELITIINSS